MAKQTFPDFFAIHHPRHAGKGGNIENSSYTRSCSFHWKIFYVCKWEMEDEILVLINTFSESHLLP